ncbi:MAG: hypothetical protein RL885_01490 [Planctomycetota bacterium]
MSKGRRFLGTLGLLCGVSTGFIDTLHAEDDKVVLECRWVLLPELPTGSYCDGAARVLEGPAVLGTVTLEPQKRVVEVGGAMEIASARGKLDRGRAPQVEAEPREVSKSLTPRMLDGGMNVWLPVPREDGRAIAVRVGGDWRGFVYGPITALEIELEDEKIYWVDADLDGRLTERDRLVYGDRSIWMPFHLPWVSGETIYDDVVFEKGEVKAAVREQPELPREQRALLARWQEVRKDQGVPPGVVDATHSQYCVEHAEYLRINNLFTHDQDASRPGATPGGAKAGASAVIYLGVGSHTVDWALSSAYHRAQILDPRDVHLQLGGNSYAQLLGGAWHSDLPGEKRSPSRVQLSPAPGSRMPAGRCSEEWPKNPALDRSKIIGLPVFCRLFENVDDIDWVSATLHPVIGGIENGKVRGEVEAHLSYPGHEAPPEFPANFDQVMLTPYQPLEAGVYEASFGFRSKGQVRELRWRFIVEKGDGR